jgi:hypothetical protein
MVLVRISADLIYRIDGLEKTQEAVAVRDTPFGIRGHFPMPSV